MLTLPNPVSLQVASGLLVTASTVQIARASLGGGGGGAGLVTLLATQVPPSGIPGN